MCDERFGSGSGSGSGDSEAEAEACFMGQMAYKIQPTSGSRSGRRDSEVEAEACFMGQMAYFACQPGPAFVGSSFIKAKPRVDFFE